MTKSVKITVSGMPITSISSPLTMGTHGPVVLDTKDIFKCIIAGARVVEVFEGYGEVVLTLSNYNTDNTPYIKAAVVKTVMDDMQKSEESSIEPATSDAGEPPSDFEEPVLSIEPTETAVSDTTVEEVTVEPEAGDAEETKTDVEPKSPEHWMPPQRGNNHPKNNNGNGNKGKKK